MKNLQNYNEFVNEARKAKAESPNDVITIDVDLSGDESDIIKTTKSFGLAVEPNGATPNSYDMTGKKKDILKYLQSDYYALNANDIEELFPEFLEKKKKKLIGKPDFRGQIKK